MKNGLFLQKKKPLLPPSVFDEVGVNLRPRCLSTLCGGSSLRLLFLQPDLGLREGVLLLHRLDFARAENANAWEGFTARATASICGGLEGNLLLSWNYISTGGRGCSGRRGSGRTHR